MTTVTFVSWCASRTIMATHGAQLCRFPLVAACVCSDLSLTAFVVTCSGCERVRPHDWQPVTDCGQCWRPDLCHLLPRQPTGVRHFGQDDYLQCHRSCACVVVAHEHHCHCQAQPIAAGLGSNGATRRLPGLATIRQPRLHCWPPAHLFPLRGAKWYTRTCPDTSAACSSRECNALWGHHRHTGKQYANMLFSDDGGTSWNASVDVALGDTLGLTECQIAPGAMSSAGDLTVRAPCHISHTHTLRPNHATTAALTISPSHQTALHVHPRHSALPKPAKCEPRHCHV